MKPMNETDVTDPPEDIARGSLQQHGCLTAFGSEILITKWEASAAQCEATAEQFRTVMQATVCSHLEKARAYRKCVEDIRRQMAHENKRQPSDNDQAH
jgi:hypothetical protein